MTLKEKGKKLVQKFLKNIPRISYWDSEEEAKQCALICQNEKIEFLGELWLKKYIIEKNYRFEMSKLFEEKQEINNL